MFVIIVRKHFDWLFSIMIIFSTSLEWEMYLMLNVIFVLYDGHVAWSISMASLLQQGLTPIYYIKISAQLRMIEEERHEKT